MTTETIETIDLAAVQVTYQRLISYYVRLLRTSAGTRFDWLVRPLFEDHMRIILLEIITGFTLLQRYVLDSKDQKAMSWIQQEIDYMTRLADQFPNIRKSLFSFLWRGLTLLFASALLEFFGSSDQTKNIDLVFRNVFGIIQTFLLSFGALLFVGVVLLMYASVFLIYNKMAGFQVEGGEDVYKLENDLFR
jgi:hypothetical protein